MGIRKLAVSGYSAAAGRASRRLRRAPQKPHSAATRCLIPTEIGGGLDVACGRRRRDGASWLALMSIGSGRYVPFSENPPGQPVALECPERPGGGVRPAAEFVRQFCFRRQLGPRRVFAAPDPPREHGVNVQVGLRVLPRIIHDQPHGQCNGSSPGGLPVLHLEHPRAAASTDVLSRVMTSLGRRQ